MTSQIPEEIHLEKKNENKQTNEKYLLDVSKIPLRAHGGHAEGATVSYPQYITQKIHLYYPHSCVSQPYLLWNAAETFSQLLQLTISKQN